MHKFAVAVCLLTISVGVRAQPTIGNITYEACGVVNVSGFGPFDGRLYAFNWGDGDQEEPQAHGPFSLPRSHRYFTNGTYTFTITGFLGNRTVGSQSASATVTNADTAGCIETLLPPVAQISANGLGTLALAQDGTVWQPTSTTGQFPNFSGGPFQRVTGLSSMVAVAMGEGHGLALKTDGTVWAWGSNSSGQLGDGTTAIRTTPVQVSGLTGIAGIAAGWYHSMAGPERWDSVGMGLQLQWSVGRRNDRYSHHPCPADRPNRNCRHCGSVFTQPGGSERWDGVGVGLQLRWSVGRRNDNES